MLKSFVEQETSNRIAMLPFIRSPYFQAVLEGFSNGMVTFNNSWEAYAVNKAACAILGLSVDECMGKSPEEIFQGVALWEEFLEYLRLADFTDPCSYPLHTRFDRKDGRVLHLTLNKSVLTDQEKVFGILVEVSDVTPIHEQHQREKRILEERNRLQRERVESLNKLSLAIAHQLRNPLTAIGGFASLLRKRLEPDSPEASYLDSIMESSTRLEDVVKAVTAYTSLRLESRQVMSMADLVDEARKTLGHRLPDLTGRVQWRREMEPLQVDVDPAFMVRALTEVMANSVEALNGSCEIAVTAAARDGGHVIEVADSGKGIHADHLPYVFDPFFTTKTVGVGMGLPLAERIVKEHGGRMHITSRPGNGTRVRLFLGHPRDDTRGFSCAASP
jgi:PAS domain S-box-containing protein